MIDNDTQKIPLAPRGVLALVSAHAGPSDTSKTQRARPFPSFSHEPHSNQDHMAPSKVLGKLGSLLHPPRNATGQSKVCVLSIFSQERALYVCALTIGVLSPPP